MSDLTPEVQARVRWLRLRDALADDARGQMVEVRRASDELLEIVSEGARLGCDVDTLAQVQSTLALCVDAMQRASDGIASTPKEDTDITHIMAAYDAHAQEMDDDK